MSIFGILGNVGKAVGKTALGVAGTALGAATGGATNSIVNANMFDNKGGAAAATTVAVAATPSVVQTSGGSVWSGLLGGLTATFNALPGFISGQTHAQVDVNTGVGGRASDPNTSSSLPSWLLPAGLALGAVMLLKPSSSGRKYS